MLFFSYLAHKAVKQSIIVLLWFCVPTEKPVSSLRFNLFCHQYILWLVFTYIFLNKWNDNLYLKNVSLNWASFYKIQKSYVLKKRILLIRSVPYCLTPKFPTSQYSAEKHSCHCQGLQCFHYRWDDVCLPKWCICH